MMCSYILKADFSTTPLQDMGHHMAREPLCVYCEVLVETLALHFSESGPAAASAAGFGCPRRPGCAVVTDPPAAH